MNWRDPASYLPASLTFNQTEVNDKLTERAAQLTRRADSLQEEMRALQDRMEKFFVFSLIWFFGILPGILLAVVYGVLWAGK